MIKNFTHTWHYILVHADNSFSLYFNDRLIAIILKPSTGRWPVHVTINEKMYSFSKNGLLSSSIKIADAMSGEQVATIKMPLISSVFATVKFLFASGEEFTWYSNNFFSLHWKWKKGNENIVDAIDNLAAKKNIGIIAIKEYKSGTDLLIISGFFLSLLKRSKLSMGIGGLKRRRIKK
jgi:hypothetical protein